MTKQCIKIWINIVQGDMKVFWGMWKVANVSFHLENRSWNHNEISIQTHKYYKITKDNMY